MKQRVDMVITDLDGTLFNDSKEISKTDLDTLHWLGEQNIHRVIATGRNLFSLKKVLPSGIPVDYLVFSTGAGVIDLKSGELIYAEHLREPDVKLAIEVLTAAKMSFMVHDLVPDNHAFLFFDASCGNNDFHRRIELYRDFAAPLQVDPPNYTHASQLLAIVPENLELLEKIRDRLDSMRVVRTTSPLDGKTMWAEIFPSGVSKGHTVEWLCNRLGVDRSFTLATGNDYNDLDLLNFAAYPFAMENAPEPVRKLYRSCRSNNKSGFTDAVCQVTGRAPGS
ncbi:MAG: HAD family phosphatase [Marinilabiliales bacterium]|nr:MAG: HAD family phosphatase [Marinilabiliales bacterium]